MIFIQDAITFCITYVLLSRGDLPEVDTFLCIPVIVLWAIAQGVLYGLSLNCFLCDSNVSK